MNLMSDAHCVSLLISFLPLFFPADAECPPALSLQPQNAAVGQTGPFHSPTCSIAFLANEASTTSSYFGVLPSLMLPTLVIRSAVKFRRSGPSPVFASQMQFFTMKS